MALIPKINICVNSKCASIDVYEETSPKVSSTVNPGGWADSNINTTQIDTASLAIKDHTGTTTHTTIHLKDSATNVYSGVSGAPYPGRFLAVSDASFTEGDGVYKLVYTVTQVGPAATYTNESQYELITCSICSCLSTLKGKIVTECDANKLEQQKEKIDQLELILYGIQTAFSCADFTTATSLIASAKTICDNLCDCGCGDCN